MAQPRSMLRFREVRVEDADMVADLDSLVEPDDPREGQRLAFWWTHPSAGARWRRWIDDTGGFARAFISAGHDAWSEGETRFGTMRVRLHPDVWSESEFVNCVRLAESWLRDEGAEVSVSRVTDHLENELSLLGSVGFREIRRDRTWRLDLVRRRESLLAGAESSRAEMKRQGVRLLTFDQDQDSDKMQKLYELFNETTDDVPKTVPWPVPTFEEWSAMWFEHPSHRPDRMWIARDGDTIVGLSIIGYPLIRGVPWTNYTCTARSVRGRGVARALKYETIAQAIAIGVERVETANDSANAPILHLNEEMGYEPFHTVIELHRELPE